MQIEMKPEDIQEFQKAIMATAVGRAMIGAVSNYLNNDYKLNNVVEEVLKQEVRCVARELMEQSDEIKNKIRKAVASRITEDIIEKAAESAISRY